MCAGNLEITSRELLGGGMPKSSSPSLYGQRTGAKNYLVIVCAIIWMGALSLKMRVIDEL